MNCDNAKEQLRQIMTQYNDILLNPLKPKKTFEELELNTLYTIVQFKKMPPQFRFEAWAVEADEFIVRNVIFSFFSLSKIFYEVFSSKSNGAFRISRHLERTTW